MHIKILLKPILCKNILLEPINHGNFIKEVPSEVELTPYGITQSLNENELIPIN